MKRTWKFLLVCAAAAAALAGYFFLLPAPAVGGGFQLLEAGTFSRHNPFVDESRSSGKEQ